MTMTIELSDVEITGTRSRYCAATLMQPEEGGEVEMSEYVMYNGQKIKLSDEDAERILEDFSDATSDQDDEQDAKEEAAERAWEAEQEENQRKNKEFVRQVHGLTEALFGDKQPGNEAHNVK